MSLDYTISNQHQSAQQQQIPNINKPYGRGGWVRQLNREYHSNPFDIDATLTGVEKYAYEHDIEHYGWETMPDGTRKYNPLAIGKVKGDFSLPKYDKTTQAMYQNQLQGSNTATQSRTGYQQASQSVFDTSNSRYAPSHQNIVNF
tara:strand:+ start:1164 stop:1598 length:435 start_codon:yes stop_codon:yes gene_type:complete